MMCVPFESHLTREQTKSYKRSSMCNIDSNCNKANWLGYQLGKEFFFFFQNHKQQIPQAQASKATAKLFSIVFCLVMLPFTTVTICGP